MDMNSSIKTSEVRPTSSIEAACDLIDNALQELEISIHNLAGRLEVVSVPGPIQESDGPEDGQDAKPMMSTLCRRLQQVREVVEGNNRRLITITRSLEI